MSAGIIERTMPRVQNRASHIGAERDDRLIDALKAGGRALEVAVIEGEHHGAARLRIEGLREAVLHAPVEVAAPLEEVAGGLLRHVRVVVLVLLADVDFWH